MSSLMGKVAIVTGGFGFLARQYRDVLGNAGATVILWDINTNVPNTRVDITDPKAVKENLELIMKTFGRVDVLINNAALNPAPNDPAAKAQFSPYESYPLELWKKEIDVGLTGAMVCIQAVAPVMMRQKSGSIINIGSHYGLVAPDNRIYPEEMFKSIAYATVKGAMLNFTRTWAAYLGPHNVRVNCLVLGGVLRGHDEAFVKKYSERTMLGRMANPDEYNSAILFLASEASSYMTGQTLVIDGGWTAL